MTAREKGLARSSAGHRLYFELGGPPGAPALLLVRGLGRSSAYRLGVRDLLERVRSRV